MMNYKCIRFFFSLVTSKSRVRFSPCSFGWGGRKERFGVQSLDFRALGFEAFRLFMG